MNAIYVPSPPHRAVILALVEIDGLLILPGEDAGELIAERDALIDEKDRTPGYTAEPSSDLEWQYGWSIFFRGLPPGIHIRTNMAMDGWKAARADAQGVDVDREVW